MIEFDVTIKNYRCFEVANPVRLEVRAGLTSLVGTNNSGKSTLLRFFYEMRAIFAAVADGGQRQNWGRGGVLGFAPLGVGDPEEIFHNRNELPVVIELCCRNAGGNQFSGVQFTAVRNNPTGWQAQFYFGPNFSLVPTVNTFPKVYVDGQERDPDPALLDQLGSELAHVLYIPATRVAIGEARGNIFDLQFGDSLIGLWHQWKAGSKIAENRAIQKVTADIAALFDLKSLEINATPDIKDLHVSVNGRPYRLRELGAGLAQFIIVLANAAVKKPVWILVDEPEISLHPSLQLDFLTTLASYASGGTLFATHSLGLARSADRVFSLRYDGDKSTLAPFEKTGSLSEFLGEMSFAAYRDLGFDAVLLIEGVNDIKTIHQFLRTLKKEHRVVVVQLGGGQLIRAERTQELSELRRLSDHVFALIDSERTAAGQDLSAERAAFLTTCEQIGITARATDRRAIEHYISDEAAKRSFGDTYRALAPFEDRKACSPVWGKSESWRAAREMTEADLMATDLGPILGTL